MRTVTKSLKPERIQRPSATVTPARLQAANGEIGDWTVDPTPNAITRHFGQPSFAASAAFIARVAELVDKHGRVPHVWIDDAGVTVRLGNAPDTGVTEADLEIADSLTSAA